MADRPRGQSVPAQDVRLVLLGGASAAPVCDGDVCYLPEAAAADVAADLAEPGDQEPTDDEPSEQRGA